MSMRRSRWLGWVCGLALATAGMPGMADGIVVEVEGWLTGDEAGQAMEAAAERGLPVALIFTDYDTA